MLTTFATTCYRLQKKAKKGLAVQEEGSDGQEKGEENEEAGVKAAQGQTSTYSTSPHTEERNLSHAGHIQKAHASTPTREVKKKTW